jgi:hypothetical protein
VENAAAFGRKFLLPAILATKITVDNEVRASFARRSLSIVTAEKSANGFSSTAPKILN